jgi:large subunit ribosomal protein L5
MVDFFERMIRIVWPRVRDFTGLDLTNVDANGVLNTGIREQSVFTEISPEQSPVSFPFGITMVPRKRNREMAIEKFRMFGVPLRKEVTKKKK